MLNLFIHKVDIVSIYLKSLLGVNKLLIFMKLPPEIDNFYQIQEDVLYQLWQSLYGLKKSSRL